MLSTKLEWQLNTLEAKLKKGDIVGEIYEAVKKRLEEQAAKEIDQRPSTIWQQEQELAEAIDAVERLRSQRPSRKLTTTSYPLVNLIKMRANGEITAEEFAAAKEQLASHAHHNNEIETNDANQFAKRVEAQKLHEIPRAEPAKAVTGVRWALTGVAAVMIFGLLILVEKGVSKRADAVTDTATSASFTDKCVSSWSGSVKSFENTVRTALGNPTGFAVVRTGLGNTEGRIVTMTMEYTFTTELGGKLRGKALGQVDSATCQTVALDAI